jgi:hypothetical protein
MSTTTDIATAVAYCISKESLIFKIITDSSLQRGAELEWLSAFPAEKEILFPPLTYLQPTGKTQVIEIKGSDVPGLDTEASCSLTIVEVKPIIA